MAADSLHFPPVHSLWRHRKQRLLVRVIGRVGIQDDLDDGGHGPYDGEEWVTYEHGRRVWARKLPAFLARFEPVVPLEAST